MKKVLIPIIIFSVCCFVPLLGLWLIRLAIPGFNPEAGMYSIMQIISIFIGFAAAISFGIPEED